MNENLDEVSKPWDVGGRTTVERPWGRSTAGVESEGQSGGGRGRRMDKKTDCGGLLVPSGL